MLRTLRRLVMSGLARSLIAPITPSGGASPPASASQVRRMRPQLAAVHTGLLAHHDVRRLAGDGTGPLRQGA